jgi:hypothetical protein
MISQHTQGAAHPATPDPAGLGSAAASRFGLHRVPTPLLVGAAAALALLMSTQILFEPFVWRGATAGELLQGWMHVARDRLTVALVTALTMFLALRWNRQPAPRRLSVLLAASIVVGATLGEALLALADDKAADPLVVAVRAAQWSVLAGCVAAIYELWQQVSLARELAGAARLRHLQTTLQLEQTRLRTLRSQIEPHFLFNTLATVRRLHQTEPPRGGLLLAHFIDYLNSALPRLNDEDATLGRELQLVRAYLGIAEVRLSGRLSTRLDVPEALLDCPLAPLTLATLVENAVKHGIAPAPEGGSIAVQACRVGDEIDISVTDTGVGFTDSKGSGIGLANIRALLEARHGSDASLTLRRLEPHGVRATIRVPWRAGMLA